MQTMRMTVSLMLTVAIGPAASGCVTAATEEETRKMCHNLIKVRGDIDDSTAEELASAARERIAREEKRLRDWKDRDLASWDKELGAKLAEAKDDVERQSLTEAYAQKKAVTVAQHDPGIAEIPAKLEAAIASAKVKAAENKALGDKAIADCVDSAKKEGVSQKVAQCRIAAKTADAYWNGCR